MARKTNLCLVACVILAACQAAPGSGSAAASASSSASESEAAASVSPTPVATAEPTPSGAVGSFVRDQIVAVVTTDLVVRSAPGTGSDSEIFPDRYDAPAAVYVVDGPSYADGYEWYLVEAVRGQGIGEYPWPGWVAAAGKDGEPWLGEDTYVCPPPSEADLLNMEFQRRLACYGGPSLTVEGTLVGCEAAVLYGSEPWETQCAVVRRGFDHAATPQPCMDCYEPTLWVLFDGDIGLKGLQAGTQIRVQGHFDDPAAQTCSQDDGFHPTRTLQVHACRMSFVGTSGKDLN
jgi:hypothetical protein